MRDRQREIHAHWPRESCSYANELAINGSFNTKCPTVLYTVHHKLMKKGALIRKITSDSEGEGKGRIPSHHSSTHRGTAAK